MWLFYVCLILGLLSIVLQFLVVWYGLKLFKIVGHTEYWSCEWKFYIVGNGLIFFRRIVGLVPLIFVYFNKELQVVEVLSSNAFFSNKVLMYEITEEVITIAVSILFLLFGKKLVTLFKNIFK